MIKEMIYDNLIEAQAIALASKNEEIKQLNGELETSRKRIADLQRQLDAGAVQFLIDQIFEELKAAMYENLCTRDVETFDQLLSSGDRVTVAHCGKNHLVKLEHLIVERDLVMESLAMSPKMQATVSEAIAELIARLNTRKWTKIVLAKLPSPLPGTGAVAQVSPTCRVVLVYDHGRLCMRLYLDALCGGMTEETC